VAYEADVLGLGRFGVCMMVIENSADADRKGPWFVRDYGMAMFNATMTRSIRIGQEETWTTGLRVMAYDGVLNEERASVSGAQAR
jgi:hypothetical protein